MKIDLGIKEGVNGGFFATNADAHAPLFSGIISRFMILVIEQ